MPATIAWAESTVQLGETTLRVSRAGAGRPVVVLHRDIGIPDGLPVLDALAQRYSVLVPHHPGFARSPRPEWMRGVRDIAVLYQALLAELLIAAPTLLGLGFGGWIAAEMATMAPAAADRLVLVGAMGVKPPAGDILDQALLNYIEYARAGFHDQAAFDRVYGADPTTDQLEAWDICREMSFRIAWKPYMYSQTLPHLLGGVGTPSLVVWGEHDRVVPVSAGQVYAAKLRNADMSIVADCGSCVEMEQPEAFARMLTDFIG
jgi:pimeloyl-ACP methyl ester carboxylesterase